MKLKSLLVVVDPTQPTPRLLAKVWRLADALRPRIEFFVCDTEESATDPAPGRWTGMSGVGDRREQLRQRRLASLEALAAPFREMGHKVSVDATWAAPLNEGIVRHVLKTNPDLVIKESHSHVPAPRGFATDGDCLLVRDCPAPLLLVKSEYWSKRPRIAAAVDPCRPAERDPKLDHAILDASSTLTTFLGGEREVFHVFEGPAHLPLEKVTREATLASHEKARVAMRALLGKEPGVAHLHYLEGDPASKIPEHVAAGGFDVLVMGSVARSRPMESHVGGAAARALEAVKCDVLVIKPDGFVSPMLTTAVTCVV
jgi:universal stress protein E